MVKLQHFKRSDFACPCCSKEKMKDNVLIKLQTARVIADIPFIISSGYRCEKHNKEVGSTAENHTRGEAFDIYCAESWLRIKIIVGLILAGFRRIGIHKTFIHVDRMDQRPGFVNIGPALWTGKNSGQ